MKQNVAAIPEIKLAPPRSNEVYAYTVTQQFYSWIYTYCWGRQYSSPSITISTSAPSRYMVEDLLHFTIDRRGPVKLTLTNER